MHPTLTELHPSIQSIWMVAVYPLVAALLIILGRSMNLIREKTVCMGLTVFATALGLIHTLVAAKHGIALGTAEHWFPTIEKNITWMQAGELSFSLGYLLDPMSLMMLFVVTFISLFIQIYTHGYMETDKGYAKFYAYLALFNFSMLGLVLSTNLFQMYMFWEMVGVCSYLLIGFWFTRPPAAAAAVKAFLMNRVGDFGLLVGILMFLFFSFPFWAKYVQENPGQAFLSFQGFGEAAKAVMAATGPGAFAVICILIFMGPMAKSAQVPLHTWLPDAMEGPTPISALIHAATMVAAGVYLVGRVYPVFSMSEGAMAFITIIGVITAVIAATIALTQYDIKKALAYSTVSQLGFMMVAMGVGAFSAGLFHLFTHAFFKAMLFLCSGSVIHAMHDEQDMRHMGGLAKHLPMTHLTYLVGTLAISGFFLSGFWSKDEILSGASVTPGVFYTLMVTAGLTAFYMFRTYFLTFTGEFRGHHEPHHESKVMTIPLLVLMVPSIAIGFLLSGHCPNFVTGSGMFPAFHDLIYFGHHAAGGHHAPAGMPESMAVWHQQFNGLPVVAWTSLLIGALGALVAFLMYASPQAKAVFAVEDALRNAPGLRVVFNIFSNKWYFDDYYKAFVDKVYLVFANASAAFDKNQIDGLVNLAGTSVMSGGNALRLLQNGKVQTYVAFLFWGMCVVGLFVMFMS
jgi:proton-translocating NADH-quinone oxidoreductase chain L